MGLSLHLLSIESLCCLGATVELLKRSNVCLFPTHSHSMFVKTPSLIIISLSRQSFFVDNKRTDRFYHLTQSEKCVPHRRGLGNIFGKTSLQSACSESDREVVCEASAAHSVKVLLKCVNRKNGTQEGTG